MPWLLRLLERFKELYDWTQFAGAGKEAAERYLGASVVNAVVGALLGAWY
jgi:hypothetical protein